MRRRNPSAGARLLALAVALAAPAAAHAQAASLACDPAKEMDDAAIQLRDRGQIDAALAKARAGLAAHPDGFRANYITATLLLAKGDQASKSRGMALLLSTEPLLRKQPPACAVPLGWYSIYNTIGVEYYRAGNIAKSREYLLTAEKNYDKLLPDTKTKLSSNLGLMYYVTNDLKSSQAYYNRAAQLGSPTARQKAATVSAIAAAPLKRSAN